MAEFIPADASGQRQRLLEPSGAADVEPDTRTKGPFDMLKFIGGTIGVIFLIGLLVVIGLFALIF